MSIQFVREDITKIKADVIVNTANPRPIIGGGTDSAVYRAAGEEKLLAERKKLGNIERGDAAVTKGFDLCDYIVHTVGPKYIDGSQGEAELLRSCYRNSLLKAKECRVKSIAFPLISTGVYGFPKEEGISIAVSEINDFLLHNTVQMDVTIAVFDDDSYAIAKRIASDMEQKILSGESREALKAEYGRSYDWVMAKGKKASAGTASKKKKQKPEDFELSEDGKDFREMLEYYLGGMDGKHSDLYTSIGIDRRLFHKLLQKDYHPSKDTALRICVGLGLTVSQTVDMLARADYAFNPSRPEDFIILRGIREHKSFDQIAGDLQDVGKYDWMQSR